MKYNYVEGSGPIPCRYTGVTKMKTKVCSGCRRRKPLVDFPPDYFDAGRGKPHKNNRCKICKRRRQKEYLKNNPDIYKKHLLWAKNNIEKVRKYGRECAHRRNVALRNELLNHYSNGTCKCALCGEKRVACLSIDHINGGGNQHRKSIRAEGTVFYWWLKKNNFPKGFRIICMNCQFV